MTAPPYFLNFTKQQRFAKTAALARTKTADHQAIFGQERSEPMRLIVKQTECAGKMFWIVRDTDHSWFYHGPFADEAAARAFVRSEKSDAWKMLLRETRENRKARKAALAA